MDRGEYDVCSYCGRSIFPDVAECPYCHRYTDGQGPFSAAESPGGLRQSKVFTIAGWLVVLGFLLPLLFVIFQWLSRR